MISRLLLALSGLAAASLIAGCGEEPPRVPTVGTPPDVIVAAAGDIACDPEDRHFNGGEGRSRNCRQRDTSDIVERIDPDAVFVLGDAQYEFGTFDRFAASYDPTWGRFKSRTYANPGDSHDFAGGGDWYAYFGDRAGPEPYKPWSFDLGDWHVISLNSACRDENVGGCRQGSPQYEWLVRDLARNTKRCTAAMIHEPRWSSASPRGGSRQIEELVSQLHGAGADLILSGHEHVYERFEPQDPVGNFDERGITQFIVGTGGRNLQRFQEVQPNSAARWRDSFGVLRLTLRPGRYEWQFVPVDEVEFADGGSRACNNAQAPDGGGQSRLRIKLSVRPDRMGAGRERSFLFRAVVSSAGRRLPVAGAVVRFARQRAVTNSRGYVRIRTRLRRPGVHKARAWGSGYLPGNAYLRIVRSRSRTPR